MEAVNHPQFGLFLDVWRFWEHSEVRTRIRSYGRKKFGVHANDWRMLRAFADRLLRGAGEIPFVDLLRAIRGTDYNGIYTLEIFSDLWLRDSLWTDSRWTVVEGRAAFAILWRRVCV